MTYFCTFLFEVVRHMVRDSELDRLKDVQQAAFDRKQRAYEAQQSAWTDRKRLAERQAKAYERQQSAFDRQAAAWQHLQAVKSANSGRIDALNNPARSRLRKHEELVCERFCGT